MPFDPTYPPTNALIESAPLRGQFNGLKALIDAVPVITAAQVDSTNTLPPSSSANAQVSVIGNTLHLTFEIPQGIAGATGPQGQPGEVTQTDLNNGLLNTLSQCSNNSNGVGTLGQNAEGGYNQIQMQDVLNKLDELISALRR